MGEEEEEEEGEGEQGLKLKILSLLWEGGVDICWKDTMS